MSLMKIKEFYGQLIDENKVDEKLAAKIRAVTNESELRQLIREEIIPLSKSMGYNFSEQQIIAYEKEVAQQFSNETIQRLQLKDLSNVSGGFSLKSAILSGGILSLAMLGFGTTASMQADAAVPRNVVEGVSEQNSNNIAIQMLVSYMQTRIIEQFVQIHNETIKSLVEVYLTKNITDTQKANATEQLLSLVDENMKSEVKEKLEKCSAVLPQKSVEETPTIDSILTETQEEIKKLKNKVVSDSEVPVVEIESKDALQNENVAMDANPESVNAVSTSMDRDTVMEVADEQAGQVRNTIDVNTKTTTKSQEMVPDYGYLMQALSLPRALNYDRTGVLENIRHFNPTNTPMVKQEDDGHFYWDYKNDSGRGMASLMAILFPSSGRNLSIGGGAPTRPALVKDCNLTPESMAQLFKIIYDYRNPATKGNIKQQVEELLQQIDSFSKVLSSKDRCKTIDTRFSNYLNALNSTDKYYPENILTTELDELVTESINCYPNNKSVKNYNGAEKNSSNKIKMLLELKTLKITNPTEEQKKFRNKLKTWVDNVQNLYNTLNPSSNTQKINQDQINQLLDLPVKNNLKKNCVNLFGDTIFLEGQEFSVGVIDAKTRLQLLRSVFDVIEMQELPSGEFDPREPNKIAPLHTPEILLLCFCLHLFNSEAELKALFTNAQKLIQCSPENINPNRVIELVQEQQNSVKLLRQIPHFKLSPYQNALQTNSQAFVLTTVEPDGTIQFKRDRFADCADIAVRHLVNLLGYSVNGNWNLLLGNLDENVCKDLDEKLKAIKIAVNAHKKFEFGSLSDRLKLFFYHQAHVGADDTEIFTRTLWEYGICNMNAPAGETRPMNSGDYYYIRYNRRNYELNPGFINTLKLIYNIAKALNLSNEVNLIAAQNAIDELQKQAKKDTKQLQEAAKLTFSLINSNVNINDEIENVEVWGSEVFGTMQITCTSEQDKLTFRFNSDPGHAWVELLNQSDAPKCDYDLAKTDIDRLLFFKGFLSPDGWLANIDLLPPFLRLFGGFMHNFGVNPKWYEGFSYFFYCWQENDPQHFKTYQALKVLDQLQGEDDNVERTEAVFRANKYSIWANGNVICITQDGKTFEVPIGVYIFETYCNSLRTFNACFGEDRNAFMSFLRKHPDCYKENDDFFYIDNGDSITLVFYKGNKNTPKIPDTIGEKRLISISHCCFYCNSNVQDIDFSNTDRNVFKVNNSRGGKQFPLSIYEFCLKRDKHFYRYTVSYLYNDNFVYKINGLYAVIEGYFGDRSVTIPANTKGGLYIDRIDTNCFANNKDINTVKFEDGSKVMALDKYVFEGCTSLTEITLPKLLYNIGERTFAGCQQLTTVKALGKIGIYLEKEAFCGCTSLKNIDSLLPHLSNISAKCFAGCLALEELTFGKDVSIQEDAFYGCQNLATVKFAKGIKLKEIKENAFRSTPSLEHVIFEGGFNSSEVNPKAFVDSKLFNIFKKFTSDPTLLNTQDKVEFFPNKVTQYNANSQPAVEWILEEDGRLSQRNLLAQVAVPPVAE